MGDSRMTLTQRLTVREFLCVYLHLRQSFTRIARTTKKNIFDLKKEIGISGVVCGSISEILWTLELGVLLICGNSIQTEDPRGKKCRAALYILRVRKEIPRSYLGVC